MDCDYSLGNYLETQFFNMLIRALLDTSIFHSMRWVQNDSVTVNQTVKVQNLLLIESDRRCGRCSKQLDSIASSNRSNSLLYAFQNKLYALILPS